MAITTRARTGQTDGEPNTPQPTSNSYEEPFPEDQQDLPSTEDQLPPPPTSTGITNIPNDLLLKLLARLAEPSNDSRASSTTPGFFSNKSPHIRAPDTFTGLDASKLKPFLSQCRLAFKADPNRYATEESKIMYAGSYLDSVAKKWFEPFLFMEPGDKDYPSYLGSFASFEGELGKLFGDPAEEATAEYHLSRLRMRDNHQVCRYIADFRHYQTVLDWNDKALQYQFRKGLPTRILDELARRDDKPTSLDELQQLALRIDLRHWERQREKQDSHSTGQPSTYRAVTTLAFRPPQSNLNLTKSGRLTPEEYRRRKDNNLCVYCGGSSHTHDKCPRARERPRAQLRAIIKSTPPSQGKE
jgi:hypothetical protein